MTAETKPTANTGRIGWAWRAAEGNYVRGLRMGMGLTQTELAHRMGLQDKHMISSVECGRMHLPPGRIMGLADAVSQPRSSVALRLLRTQHPWIFACLSKPDTTLLEELRIADEQKGRWTLRRCRAGGEPD